jgi:lysophospholipase L1-like esterase
MMNRRQFVASSAGALAASSSLHCAAAEESDRAGIRLDKGDVLLFQGDSITDVGRNRKTQDTPNDASALGRGYVGKIAKALLEDHDDLELRIFNRGISGNKVPDLDRRWQRDALDLQPAVISILIGVNDIWHKLNGRYDGTPQDYRDGFAALLRRTRDALPEVQLVICEPFVLRCGAVKDSWFPEFEERLAFAQQVAEEANALWVPFQQVFNEQVAAGSKPSHWAKDGVHPTDNGHALMAQTWRETTRI